MEHILVHCLVVAWWLVAYTFTNYADVFRLDACLVWCFQATRQYIAHYKPTSTYAHAKNFSIWGLTKNKMSGKKWKPNENKKSSKTKLKNGEWCAMHSNSIDFHVRKFWICTIYEFDGLFFFFILRFFLSLALSKWNFPHKTVSGWCTGFDKWIMWNGSLFCIFITKYQSHLWTLSCVLLCVMHTQRNDANRRQKRFTIAKQSTFCLSVCALMNIPFIRFWYLWLV